jgi:cytochrome P450 family 13
LAEWTQKYGKVYGVQRGNTHALVVSDQQLAREVMNEKFDCFYARDLTPLNGNPDKKAVAHVFLARGLRWKRLRTLTSMVFTTKSLRKVFVFKLADADFFRSTHLLQHAGNKCAKIWMKIWKRRRLLILHCKFF